MDTIKELKEFQVGQYRKYQEFIQGLILVARYRGEYVDSNCRRKFIYAVPPRIVLRYYPDQEFDQRRDGFVDCSLIWMTYDSKLVLIARTYNDALLEADDCFIAQPEIWEGCFIEIIAEVKSWLQSVQDTIKRNEYDELWQKLFPFGANVL
jgi:hypothetical protein